MNRSLSSRSMRFATWVLLASLAIGNPQNLRAGLYPTQAAAGINADLVPRPPVAEGGVMTLGVNTNVDVEFPGCFRWFKGGLLSEKQGVDQPILSTKGAVLGYKSTLTFQPAKKSDTGVYSCDVLGTDGKNVRTSLVQYLVATKPQIVLHPRSKLVVDSREFMLRVDPLTSSQAAFNSPAGVAVDQEDDEMIYVADTENSLIRRVTPGGSVSLFAGTTGTIDPNSFRIDNPGSNFAFNPYNGTTPPIVFFDGRNGGGGNHRAVTTVGVTRTDGTNLATQGVIYNPALNPFTLDPLARFVAAPPVVIADGFGGSGVNAAASVQHVPGHGFADTPGGALYPPTMAKFNKPEGIAISPDGKMYIADTKNHVIRMIDLRSQSPSVVTVAGTPNVAGWKDGISPKPAVLVTNSIVGGSLVNTPNWTSVRTGVGGITPNATFLNVSFSDLNGGPLVGVGTLAATATTDSNGVLRLNFTQRGSNINQPVKVTVMDNAGAVQLATGVIQNSGAIGVVDVASSGAGYDLANPPSIYFSNPTAPILSGVADSGMVAQGSAVITPILTSATVVNGGTGWAVSGTLNFYSNVAGGTATATYQSVNGVITSVTPLRAGVNIQPNTLAFSTAPGVDLPNGTVILAGTSPAVTGVTVTNPGAGYSSAALPMVTVAGGSYTLLNSPRGLKVDRFGNVLIADSDNHAIRMLQPIPVNPQDPSAGYSYALTTVAGRYNPDTKAGEFGNSDGFGSQSRFYGPRDVAVYSTKSKYYVYVADYVNHTVRRIELKNLGADGKPALNDPNLSAQSVVIKYAGRTEFSGYQNGPGSSAMLSFPAGLEMDPSGNGVVYVADLGNNMIRGISPLQADACNVSTYAGDENRIPGAVDGVPAGARFYYPKGVAFNSTGTMYVADRSSHILRKIAPLGGLVSTHAGIPGVVGQWDSATEEPNTEFFYQWLKNGLPLEDGPLGSGAAAPVVSGAQSAELRIRSELANLAETNSGVYSVRVCSLFRNNFGLMSDSLPAKVVVRQTDFPYLVRKVKVGDVNLLIDLTDDVKKGVEEKLGASLNNPTYSLSTLDGSDLPSWIVQQGAGSPLFTLTPPAAQSRQNLTLNLAVSDSNYSLRTLLVLDVAPYDAEASGKPVVVAAPRSQVVRVGDDAAPLSVAVQGNPSDFTFQWFRNGDPLTGETNATLNRNAVRSDTGGFYSVRIQNKSDGQSTTTAPAQLVVVTAPEIAVQPKDVVLVPDPARPNTQSILSVSPVIHASALFNFPYGIARNRVTNDLIVADSQNHLLRRVLSGGEVSNAAGSAGQSGDVDNNGASARLNGPSTVAATATGDVLFADTGNNKVKRISSSDRVSTLFSGLLGPKGVASDSQGNVYVSDTGRHTVKVIHTVRSVIGVLVTNAGSGLSVTNPPKVRFSDRDVDGNLCEGVGAVGEAVVGPNGNLLGVNILNQGTGYRTAPRVEFFDATDEDNRFPLAIGAKAILSGVLSDTATVVQGGSGYDVPPVLTLAGGGVSEGTAAVTVDAQGRVVSITLTNAGSGYTTTPTVEVVTGTGASGSGATAVAEILDGSIKSIRLLTQGSGYSASNPPVVKITGGGLQLAKATARMGVGSVRILNSGDGYSSVPDVEIAPPTAPNGRTATAVAELGIRDAAIVSQLGVSLPGAYGINSFGNGYSNGAPTLEVSPPRVWDSTTGTMVPVAGGVTARLEARVVDNKVTGVEIKQPGKGYVRAVDGGTSALNTITVWGSSGSTVLTGSGFQLGFAPLDSGTLVALPGGGTVFKQVYRIADSDLVETGGGRYGKLPTASVIGGGGSRAVAKADMGINQPTVLTGGSFYTTPPQVSFSGGGGTGASASAVMGVDLVTVTNLGVNKGYISKPRVTLSSEGDKAPALAEARMGIAEILVKPGTLGAAYVTAPTSVTPPLAVTMDWLPEGTAPADPTLPVGSPVGPAQLLPRNMSTTDPANNPPMPAGYAKYPYYSANHLVSARISSSGTLEFTRNTRQVRYRTANDPDLNVAAVADKCGQGYVSPPRIFLTSTLVSRATVRLSSDPEDGSIVRIGYEDDPSGTGGLTAGEKALKDIEDLGNDRTVDYTSTREVIEVRPTNFRRAIVYGKRATTRNANGRYSLDGFWVLDPGYGYNAGTPTVTLVGGGNQAGGAKATVELEPADPQDVGNMRVRQVVLDPANKGSNYEHTDVGTSVSSTAVSFATQVLFDHEPRAIPLFGIPVTQVPVPLPNGFAPHSFSVLEVDRNRPTPRGFAQRPTLSVTGGGASTPATLEAIMGVEDGESGRVRVQTPGSGYVAGTNALGQSLRPIAEFRNGGLVAGGSHATGNVTIGITGLTGVAGGTYGFRVPRVNQSIPGVTPRASSGSLVNGTGQPTLFTPWTGAGRSLVTNSSSFPTTSLANNAANGFNMGYNQRPIINYNQPPLSGSGYKRTPDSPLASTDPDTVCRMGVTGFSASQNNRYSMLFVYQGGTYDAVPTVAASGFRRADGTAQNLENYTDADGVSFPGVAASGSAALVGVGLGGVRITSGGTYSTAYVRSNSPLSTGASGYLQVDSPVALAGTLGSQASIWSPAVPDLTKFIPSFALAGGSASVTNSITSPVTLGGVGTAGTGQFSSLPTITVGNPNPSSPLTVALTPRMGLESCQLSGGSYTSYPVLTVSAPTPVAADNRTATMTAACDLVVNLSSMVSAGTPGRVALFYNGSRVGGGGTISGGTLSIPSTSLGSGAFSSWLTPGTALPTTGAWTVQNDTGGSGVNATIGTATARWTITSASVTQTGRGYTVPPTVTPTALSTLGGVVATTGTRWLQIVDVIVPAPGTANNQRFIANSLDVNGVIPVTISGGGQNRAAVLNAVNFTLFGITAPTLVADILPVDNGTTVLASGRGYSSQAELNLRFRTPTAGVAASGSPLFTVTEVAMPWSADLGSQVSQTGAGYPTGGRLEFDGPAPGNPALVYYGLGISNVIVRTRGTNLSAGWVLQPSDPGSRVSSRTRQPLANLPWVCQFTTVTGYTVTDQGGFYDSLPTPATVTVDNTNADVFQGSSANGARAQVTSLAVTGVTITYSGWGYTSLPDLIITVPNGGPGSGARVVNSQNQLDKPESLRLLGAVVRTSGSGYSPLTNFNSVLVNASGFGSRQPQYTPNVFKMRDNLGYELQGFRIDSKDRGILLETPPTRVNVETAEANPVNVRWDKWNPVGGGTISGGTISGGTFELDTSLTVSLQPIDPRVSASINYRFPYKGWDRVQGTRPGGMVTSLTVAGIDVRFPGGGYTQVPSVTIDSPTQSGSVPATARVDGMKVVGMVLTSPGSNYTSIPTVNFVGGGGTGASAEVKSLRVLNFRIEAPGRGFTSAPTYVITRSQGDNPHGEFPVDNDNATPVPPTGLGLTNISMVDRGDGYTELPTVSIRAFGNGGGATARVVGLSLSSVTVDDRGAGYSVPPTATLTAVNTAAVGESQQPVGSGAVVEMATTELFGLANIGLISGGSGYVSPPEVVIEGGGGSGAAAVAELQGGSVSRILLTNPGRDYTASTPPIVTLRGVPLAGGSVATARAFVRNPLRTIGSGQAGYRDGGANEDPVADAGKAPVEFSSPTALALDKSGALYVADTGNHVIRRITAPLASDRLGRRIYNVTTYAGTPNSSGMVDGYAGSAKFKSPEGLVVAAESSDSVPAGTVFVADTGNHAIRRVSTDGMVSTLANQSGLAGYLDSASALQGRLDAPKGLELANSLLLIADQGNHALRTIALDQANPALRTMAGIGRVVGSANNNDVQEYSYQWLKNGKPIDGATSSTLLINNDDPLAVANYSVIVQNIAGRLTSAVVSAKSRKAPTFISDPPLPVRVTVSRGQGQSLSVAVSADPIPSFQWYRRVGSSWVMIQDGPDWAGATTSTLTLKSPATGFPNSNGAQPGHTGDYQVRVGANLGLNLVSNVCRLEVLHAPILGNTIRRTVDIATGTQHNVAVDQSGSLYTWGYNADSQLGNRGNDINSIPLLVSSEKWARVAAGRAHSLGIRDNGTSLVCGRLFSWGSNVRGQLGNNGNTSVTTPTQMVGSSAINGGSLWLAVAAYGDHSLAIRADRFYGPKTGTGWGIRGSDNNLIFRSISGESNVPQLGAGNVWIVGQGEPSDSDGNVGDYFIDASAGGTLWGWGNNEQGQIVDQAISALVTPQQIRTGTPSVDTTWKSVATGDGFTVAVTTSGVVWSWGRNDKGQLGDGTNINRAAPAPIPGLEPISKVSAGADHVLAIPAGSTGIFAWGSNEGGKIGPSPVPATQTTPYKLMADRLFLTVSAGADHSTAIDLTGTQAGALHAWGRNNRGQLGLGTLSDDANPAQVRAPAPYSNVRWKTVCAGAQRTLAETEDGMLWSWGANDAGTVGNGLTSEGVAHVLVVNAGSGYSSNTSVQFISSSAGNGASASAVVSGGTISAVRVLTRGLGYESAPQVSLVDPAGTGSGGVLRATLDQPFPAKIGTDRAIVVDENYRPLAFNLIPGAPPFVDVAVVENPANPLSTTYVWRKGTSLQVPGSAGSKTRLSMQAFGTAEIDGSDYSLTVSNDRGSTTSGSAVKIFRVPDAYLPVSGGSAQSVTASISTRVTLRAPVMPVYPGDSTATYNRPTYQWTFRSLTNPGLPQDLGTSETPNLVIPQALASDSGLYTVTVRADFGTSQSGVSYVRSYSAERRLRVVADPVVLWDPTSLALSTRASQAGQPDPIYVQRGQTFRMGVLVPSPVSEVFNVTSGGSGYTQAPQVVLSRDAGDTTGSGASAVAVMNGDRVASIQLVTPGSDYAKPPVVSFVGACTSPATATAALDTGVTYRWTKGSSLSNGVQIPTASEASYTVTIPADVGQADTVSGMYSVTVTNNANRSGVVTDPFGYDGVWNLVLQWAPRVLKYPDARTEVEQNADVTLSAVVSASTRPQPVSYQWLFRSAANGGGSPTETLEDIMDPSKYQPLSDTLDNTVSGSNTPTLRLRSVSAQRNGRFVLRAQNEVQGQIQTVYTFRDNAGIDYGNVVVLNATNFQAPRINSLKIGPNLSDLRTGSYVARQGSSVVMTAEATGGALSYQWFRDRIPLLGQTGPTLNLYRVQTGQAGTYTVQVRNSKGFREAFVRLSVMRDSSQEAATGTVTVDRTLLRSFFSMPTIPQSGQLPVGTRLRLFGTVPTGSSLRGWNVRNTPDDGFSVPSTYVVNGALGQIIVGSGVTVITPKVGRSFAGSYNGLLTIGRPWDDFGASTVVDPGGTKGVVRLTVTSGGVVSGQAVVEGYTYPFTSMMDASGLATFTVQVSDGSRVVGTVQADITDGSVDAGLRVTLGNDTNKVPVNRPPTSSGGPNVVAREILYSLAACGNGVNFGENSTYTAAVCRGEWSSLGRGGVFFIRTTSATQASGFNPLVIVAGYLGNGSSFSYSGVPGLRYPDQAADAEDWDAGSRGSVSDAAGSLANYAMSELLLRKTGAIALPIHLNGESSTRPVIRPLVGTMIFSPQGIIGSLGLVDVDRPNTADASLVYSSNLIRGFAYQTNVGSTSATASGGGLPNTTVTFSSAPLASPFDADGKNAALYSEFTFPANSPFYPRGNAIAALTLKTTSYGSSFEQRTPLATESVASNISVAGGGKVVVRWLSSSLGTSSGADAGLFSTSFLEDNSDFQVGASRPNVPPVIFSGNTSQVTDRVYGVVLQSDSQKLSAGPGGYGFMIRGNAAQDSLSKTLGLGEVEVATSATNPNVRYFRTEAIQLRAQ